MDDNRLRFAYYKLKQMFLVSVYFVKISQRIV